MSRFYIALAVIAAFGCVIGWAYLQGASDVRQDVEIQNEEAGNAADKAELGWRQCLDAGGVFRFESGKCEGLE
jgi:hypothetical protein